jgi:CBS domain-containing protein
MATDIVFFEEDEDLMTIFRTLVEDNFRRVPILSNGKLTGIISRRDIINFLAEKSNENAC